MDDLNVRTRVACPLDPVAGVAQVSALAARALAFLPRSPRFGRERGHRVLWTEGSALRFRDVVHDPRGYAVLGRHRRAHIRLLGDPTIALRHFVLRAGRAADGEPALHVRDLLAPVPLFVDDEQVPRYACSIRGSFSARIGGHVICALPFDGCAPLPPGGGPGRGDRSDEEDEDDDGDDDEARVESEPDEERARRELRGGGDRGAASRWRPARSAGEVDVCTRTTDLGSLVDAARPRAYVALELIGRKGRVTRVLGAEPLDGLVILGRYPRCLEGAALFSENVSRMHVALTRSGDALEVLDLASTQGVWVDGARARRGLAGDGSTIALTDAGDELVRVRMLG